MNRGLPEIPLFAWCDAEPGPDPRDPDPDVGPEVEAVDPFWLFGYIKYMKKKVIKLDEFHVFSKHRPTFSRILA